MFRSLPLTTSLLLSSLAICGCTHKSDPSPAPAPITVSSVPSPTVDAALQAEKQMMIGIWKCSNEQSGGSLWLQFRDDGTYTFELSEDFGQGLSGDGKYQLLGNTLHTVGPKITVGTGSVSNAIETHDETIKISAGTLIIDGFEYDQQLPGVNLPKVDDGFGANPGTSPNQAGH